MTTRSRSRPRGTASYTARLQQRSTPARPVRQWPAWLTTPLWPALFALAAEAGHLTATVVEWPTTPLRGLFHVLAAACLGLLAASVYFGPIRGALTLGIGLTTTLPGAWPVGALLGLSPFRDYPVPAAVGLAVAELLLAGLLTAHRIASAAGQQDRQHTARARAR